MKTRIAICLLAAAFIGAVVCLRFQSERRGEIVAEKSAPTAGQTPRARIAAARASAAVTEMSLADYRAVLLTNQEYRAQKSLTETELQQFLEASHTNAIALLTSFEISRNVDLLKMAAQKYPNDSLVQARLLMNDVFPEDRAKWIDALRKSDPNNSLPDLLAARDRVKAGNTEGALEEISKAINKQYNDYTRESAQGLEEAYLMAGRSPLEAKVLGGGEVTLPQLVEIKKTGNELVNASKGLASSDPGQQAALLEANWQIAQQMRSAGKQGTLIGELVGLAMENNTLRNWPANATADFLDQSVADQLAANTTYRKDIKMATQVMETWFSSAPEPEALSYLDRAKMFGEHDALNWLRDRHPELAP